VVHPNQGGRATGYQVSAKHQGAENSEPRINATAGQRRRGNTRGSRTGVGSLRPFRRTSSHPLPSAVLATPDARISVATIGDSSGSRLGPFAVLILDLCGNILTAGPRDAACCRVGRSGGSRARASLNAGGTQTEKAIVLERASPGEELLFRHLIAPARILDWDHAAGHRRHDRGFAASYPPPSVWWRQLDHKQRAG